MSSIQALFSNSSSSDSDSRSDGTAARLGPVPLAASLESGATTVPERVRRTWDSAEVDAPSAPPADGLTTSDARMVPARFRAGRRLTAVFGIELMLVTLSRRECARVKTGPGADEGRVSPSDCAPRSPGQRGIECCTAYMRVRDVREKGTMCSVNDLAWETYH